MDRLEKALEKARQERVGNVAVAAWGHAAPRRAEAPLLPVVMPTLTPAEDVVLEQHRILAHHARRPEADIFRILRTQVLHIMNKSGYRTLAITSPHYGDGKTTIALNLALSIALDLKQTVLVADLDLRKPNLYEFLGLDPATGLTNHLLHDKPLRECLVRMSFERLSVLPAGPALDHSSEVLGSPKMAAVAHELKTRYADRFIIYDMPPVLAQDDSIAFLPHVDAALVVVLDNVTRTGDLKRCLDALGNANVIGTVLNDCTSG
ncbi:MAG TPA: CpsD/CapB family tyrosine-protein kinase [Alphaproteobacteria bacterium]|nr:CpsD/CapB family tyrosine-protein kinase [Alphaproteobacteria bacterium]